MLCCFHSFSLLQDDSRPTPLLEEPDESGTAKHEPLSSQESESPSYVKAVQSTSQNTTPSPAPGEQTSIKDSPVQFQHNYVVLLRRVSDGMNISEKPQGSSTPFRAPSGPQSLPSYMPAVRGSSSRSASPSAGGHANHALGVHPRRSSSLGAETSHKTSKLADPNYLSLLDLKSLKEEVPRVLPQGKPARRLDYVAVDAGDTRKHSLTPPKVDDEDPYLALLSFQPDNGGEQSSRRGSVDTDCFLTPSSPVPHSVSGSAHEQNMMNATPTRPRTSHRPPVRLAASSHFGHDESPGFEVMCGPPSPAPFLPGRVTMAGATVLPTIPSSPTYSVSDSELSPKIRSSQFGNHEGENNRSFFPGNARIYDAQSGGLTGSLSRTQVSQLALVFSYNYSHSMGEPLLSGCNGLPAATHGIPVNCCGSELDIWCSVSYSPTVVRT